MKNLKQIRHMQAGQKGIAYFSSRGDKICTVSLDENGNILKDSFIPESPFFPEYFIRIKVFDEPTNIILFGLFNLPLFILAGILKNKQLFSFALLFMAFVSYRLFKLLFVAYHMKVSKRLYKTSKFVAASHMATNAYNKLQRIPTIEEARNFSKFSKHSHLTHIFDMILTHIFIELFMFIAPPLQFGQFMLLTCIAPILLSVLAFSGALNFLQAIVTTNPTDKEIEVAIEGIRAFEEMEKNVKVIMVEE